jgi:poly-gamma-glutamate synthase PgsB/CapB
MQKARPDPGAMIAVEIDFFGRRISFVNGFAANDPESTAHIWGMALQTFPEKKKRIAVFNCREDRADRSRQLGEACPSWPAADHYVAIGTGTTIFARAAERAGLDGSKLVFAEDRSVAEVFELLIELAGRSALIMGMGNIGGQGLELVAYFRNRSILPEPA